jgi:hypothetical protein
MRALWALGLDVSETVGQSTTQVQQVHRAIATGVFRAVGPASKPTQVIPDQAAYRVYDAIRGISSAVGAAAMAALARYPGQGEGQGSCPLSPRDGCGESRT